MGLAIIDLGLQMVASRAITSEHMSDIFKALPKGSSVVSFGEDINKGSFTITVSSDEFVDTVPGALLPRILVIFRRNYYGVEFFDKLDMSTALKANSSSQASVNPQLFIPSGGINPIELDNYEYSFEHQAIDQGCQHEMKEYIGIMHKFNYCTKCGEKLKE